jgi:hypothetical protein
MGCATPSQGALWSSQDCWTSDAVWLCAAGTSGAAPSPMVRRRLAVGGVAGLVGAAAEDSFLLARPLGATLDPVNTSAGK